MTFEVEDKAKGSWQEFVLPSSITWYDFQQKAAEALNIFPSKLQLQYCFSNNNKKLLPFDLNSHMLFGSMCNKLRLFVVLEILKNGRKSTHKMKLVTVTLFNKDTEGEDCCSSTKNSNSDQLRAEFEHHLYRILLSLLWASQTFLKRSCLIEGRWPEKKSYRNGIVLSTCSLTSLWPVGMIRITQVSVLFYPWAISTSGCLVL